MDNLKLDKKSGDVEKTANSDSAGESTKNHEAKERIYLGETRDGISVYDRDDSHLHKESGLTPELLAESLSRIDTAGRGFVREKVVFDHIVGERTCVDTGSEDEIVMVYRKDRSGQTPMVKNRETEPCDSVMVVMAREDPPYDDDFKMITAYIGKESPREPWDPGISTKKDRQEAEEYWNSHAIVYNEDLIDWDKTKAYEFMSESAKRTELIRQRTFFAGLFIDPEELSQKIQPTLERVNLFQPHITTAFKPSAEQLHLDQLGSSAKIIAVGYGNDGENEGLLVRIESDNPEIQADCDALETPHITISVSRRGKPKNTAKLDFNPLTEPFELNAKYGIFCQGMCIENQNELAQLESIIEAETKRHNRSL